jgi:hypothetical protein
MAKRQRRNARAEISAIPVWNAAAALPRSFATGRNYQALFWIALISRLKYRALNWNSLSRKKRGRVQKKFAAGWKKHV